MAEIEEILIYLKGVVALFELQSGVENEDFINGIKIIIKIIMVMIVIEVE